MKRKISVALQIFGAGVAVFVIYNFIIVVSARKETPLIVEKALQSEAMRLELADLTREQRHILLKVQDPNFYYHKGYDFSTPGTGLTTISQGLVKIFYFDDFKPGVQKIKQTLIARFAFDALTPKDTILKLFINKVYLGHHQGKAVNGFEDASRIYYSKSFNQLSEAEYLSLVAMIRAPATFHCIAHKNENQLRVSRIKTMLAGDYVPADNSDWLYDRK
ncbi:transglycosylase domain-containing protein [Fulvivirgaceae bacterium PWU4]|uniref:Transglycosylase domain-containing protein n=1 Tax=Chryseosolibacter histidini TaxID=2782349 RepID=A0AAP2DTH4_9BACT|nr:transglycosylase domain-containing protein [Chryseosolibacter histidini]MBT1701038.1 transglycosylase domain-containing protein [Chryseosolibacter histidini]